MGLFNTTHLHRHESNVYQSSPDKIEVNITEKKAPTDESIMLLDEMHDKAMKNIMAKVRVENNIVNGECFLVNQPWNANDLKVVFKFKINDKEFLVEKDIDRSEFLSSDGNIISTLNQKLNDYSNSVMLFYALKMFTAVAYEQIMGVKADDRMIKSLTMNL